MTKTNKQMFNKHIILYVVVITLFLVSPVSANIFINPSFESSSGTQNPPLNWSFSGQRDWAGTTDTVQYCGSLSHMWYKNTYSVEGILYQNVDLTGVDKITVYSMSTGCSYARFEAGGIWTMINGAHGWTKRELDVSGLSGNHDVKLRSANSASSHRVYWDCIFDGDTDPWVPLNTSINFYPDIDTDDTPPGQIQYYVNGDDVTDGAFWQLYRSIDTHDIPWWDEEHTIIGPNLIDMGYCWDVDYNYIYNEEITVNIDTEDYYDYNCTYEVILYGFYIPGQLDNDSFYYYIDLTENPDPTPEPTPDPSPDPTPSSTPTPQPTATPQPDPEPINQTLNTTFIHGYSNLVNNTMDGFFVPMYNFSDYVAQPLTSLNYTLSNFTVMMNESFNSTSVNLGISTSILFIIMAGFPQKIINVFAYYLVWVIILLIFKGET